MSTTTPAPSLALYHGTFSEFAIGDVITATKPTSFYPDVVRLLDAHRPARLPSRETCVFATDTIAGAGTFINKQPPVGGAKGRVYKVEMSGSCKAPFQLVVGIARRLEAARPADTLVAEYWNPTLDWFFWEYFGPSFTVIEEVPVPPESQMSLFGVRYMKDERFLLRMTA